jgi:hypothetical protein
MSTFTASRCNTCHYPLEPQLIEVTLFDDELPRWTIGWFCPNTYLHKRMFEQQQKANTDD